MINGQTYVFTFRVSSHVMTCLSITRLVISYSVCPALKAFFLPFSLYPFWPEPNTKHMPSEYYSCFSFFIRIMAAKAVMIILVIGQCCWLFHYLHDWSTIVPKPCVELSWHYILNCCYYLLGQIIIMQCTCWCIWKYQLSFLYPQKKPEAFHCYTA